MVSKLGMLSHYLFFHDFPADKIFYAGLYTRYKFSRKGARTLDGGIIREEHTFSGIWIVFWN